MFRFGWEDLLSMAPHLMGFGVLVYFESWLIYALVPMYVIHAHEGWSRYHQARLETRELDQQLGRAAARIEDQERQLRRRV